MDKDPNIFLRHILESIEAIENHMAGISWDDFEQSLKSQDAVARRLEIIGEAVKNLSDEFKARRVDVPWKDIAGMRNNVIHEYFNVDTQLVWTITQKELPVLKNQIMDILDKLKS